MEILLRAECKFFLPYGAIFAFFPQKDEIEKVLKTGESTEVRNGVEGVNFRDNPERLVGIITTDENIDMVKEWCSMYEIDSKKVFTHDEFLKKCEQFTKNENKGR